MSAGQRSGLSANLLGETWRSPPLRVRLTMRTPRFGRRPGQPWGGCPSGWWGFARGWWIRTDDDARAVLLGVVALIRGPVEHVDNGHGLSELVGTAFGRAPCVQIQPSRVCDTH